MTDHSTTYEIIEDRTRNNSRDSTQQTQDQHCQDHDRTNEQTADNASTLLTSADDENCKDMSEVNEGEKDVRCDSQVAGTGDSQPVPTVCTDNSATAETAGTTDEQGDACDVKRHDQQHTDSAEECKDCGNDVVVADKGCQNATKMASLTKGADKSNAINTRELPTSTQNEHQDHLHLDEREGTTKDMSLADITRKQTDNNGNGDHSVQCEDNHPSGMYESCPEHSLNEDEAVSNRHDNYDSGNETDRAKVSEENVHPDEENDATQTELVAVTGSEEMSTYDVDNTDRDSVETVLSAAVTEQYDRTDVEEHERTKNEASCTTVVNVMNEEREESHQHEVDNEATGDVSASTAVIECSERTSQDAGSDWTNTSSISDDKTTEQQLPATETCGRTGIMHKDSDDRRIMQQDDSTEVQTKGRSSESDEHGLTQNEWAWRMAERAGSVEQLESNDECDKDLKRQDQHCQDHDRTNNKHPTMPAVC